MKQEILSKKKDNIATANLLIAHAKRTLNVCQLSNFSNKENMDEFYHLYFLNVSEKFKDISLFDLFNLYNDTLSDTNFCKKMVYYVSSYTPSSSRDPFKPLYDLYHEDFKNSKNQILSLNKSKSFITSIRNSILAIFNTALSQINFSPEIPILKNKIIGKLDSFLIDIQNHINELIAEKSESSSSDPDWEKLTESVSTKVKDTADKAKDAVITAKVNTKKIENAFDNTVTKKVNKLKEERKNMKHSEMVGESLRINREIKRIFKVLPIALISPAIAATIYVGSIIIDEKTDAKDKAELINDVKLEMKILDEKIQKADSAGDTKTKVKLMREHDKLERFLFKMKTNSTEYNKIIK